MPADTIALQLERDRLRSRMRRMELVTAALRDRAVYRHAVTGATPTPLRQAIEGFESELAGIRRRLAELSSAPAAAGRRPRPQAAGVC